MKSRDSTDQAETEQSSYGHRKAETRLARKRQKNISMIMKSRDATGQAKTEQPSFGHGKQLRDW